MRTRTQPSEPNRHICTIVQSAAVIDRAEATQDAADALAKRLKAEPDDEADVPRTLDGTMYADLLDAALSDVNWQEIATNHVEGTDRDEIERQEAGEVRVEVEEE